MALKWEDELYETECTGLDVAVTRTGMVSLTATFKPVEIDGTMVSRAYVHNFTIYKNLALGIGDKLMVYSGKFIPILHEYVMIVRKDSPVLIPILMTQSSTVDIRDMPGATWRDVIAAVLETCKEPVALSFLYEQIEPHKKAQSNKWWKEKIRQTLQINPMHFTHDGRGLWSLNRNAA